MSFFIIPTPLLVEFSGVLFFSSLIVSVSRIRILAIIPPETVSFPSSVIPSLRMIRAIILTGFHYM